MTYTLTEEQLKALVANAAEQAAKTAAEQAAKTAAEQALKQYIALTQGANGTDASEDPAAPVSASKAIKISEFNKEQYQEALDVMEANRGSDEQPKVGIFWYNRANKELFGVVTRKTSDFTKANARGGLVTCTEMHEDVWKKGFRKQRYHGDGTGPYIGAYEDKPRGRVFYSPKDNLYIIAVGHWINDHQEAISLIMEEFNLPTDGTTIQIAEHWDIGQKWM